MQEIQYIFHEGQNDSFIRERDVRLVSNVACAGLVKGHFAFAA